jgi:hypothetical protein
LRGDTFDSVEDKMYALMDALDEVLERVGRVIDVLEDGFISGGVEGGPNVVDHVLVVRGFLRGVGLHFQRERFAQERQEGTLDPPADLGLEPGGKVERDRRDRWWFRRNVHGLFRQ